MIMSLQQKKTKFMYTKDKIKPQHLRVKCCTGNKFFASQRKWYISTPLSASHLMSVTAVDFWSYYNALVCYITTNEIHVPDELSRENLISLHVKRLHAKR